MKFIVICPHCEIMFITGVNVRRGEEVDIKKILENKICFNCKKSLKNAITKQEDN